MPYDLVIVGGTLVVPGGGAAQGTVAVSGERIVAILSRDSRPASRKVIDADGRFVLPGVIETHSHLGAGHGVEDFSTEIGAGALGGVTTTVCFLRSLHGCDEAYDRIVHEGERRAHADFACHLVLLTADDIRNVPRHISHKGITSFKVFMTYRGEDAKGRDLDGRLEHFPDVTDGFLLQCFEAVRDAGGVVMVHAENIEMIQYVRTTLREAGRDDMAAWQASRPPAAEWEAIRRVAAFIHTTGAKVVVVHVTTGSGIREIARAKADALPMYAEVCHPYLLLEDHGRLEPAQKILPPLRSRDDVEALWDHVERGVVDTIASDHLPRRVQDKLGSVWTSATGGPGSPMLLPALITEGYRRRGIPLSRLAELTSRRPAQLYGLYPRKGSLQPGSDADLVVVDVDAKHTVRGAEMGAYSDFSVYDGRELYGWPTHTIVRGKIVAEGGQLVGEPGWGRFLRRGPSGTPRGTP